MNLAGADPVALVVATLTGHPQLAAAGVPDGGVGGGDYPPYPRVLVTDPAGPSLGDARWLVHTTIQVDVLGDVQGAPGKHILKGVGYAVIDVLTALTGRTPAPGEPVITNVDVGTLAATTTRFGANAYTVRATLTSHP